MPEPYDWIVLGSEPDGLVTAALLAKAGRRVLLLDGHERAGGAFTTEETFPGFRFDVYPRGTGWLNPALVEALGLSIEPLSGERTAIAPAADGRLLELWTDVERTMASIRCFSEADVGRWIAFSKRVVALSRVLRQMASAAPPGLSGSGPAGLLPLMQLGVDLRRLGQHELAALLRLVPMPVFDLLNEWFETDVLKGTIGAGGVLGLQQGPRSAGTAWLLAHHGIGEDAGVFRRIRRVRGGLGSLVNTLVDAARQNGAEIRLGAAPARIEIRDGQVSGVTLAGGETIAARAAASSLSPRHTFALLDPGVAGA
ncbi:MAG: NAD(P)/FAD-dependent oxidoreductase, partial [Anaerolineae bacterium]|nr:NAD(P)/FAD-dependent oxidoreductase [Anaerolineae bacterium]